MKSRLGLAAMVFSTAGFITIGLSLSTTVVAKNNDSGGDAITHVEARITGQLKTRNYVITIYAGPSGPLYTVIDDDGNVRGVQMPPAMLAERFPVLKSIVDNPADNAALSDLIIEAPTRLFEGNL